MKFLSPINVNTEYTLPFVDGTNGQVLTTDGNGAVYWGSVSAGATNLNALTDVELTNPTSGQILRYAIPPGGTLPVWYNWTPTFLTAESDTLSTVTSRGASTSYAVTFNGDVSIGTAADLSFGSVTRQMINLWSTGYGIGVQSSTTYFRSDSGFAWFRGGVHNNTANNPGAEGVLAMRIDSSSNLVVTGSTTASSFVKTGGTASQFLKADGSVDTNTYLTSFTETDTLATVTARGATTTGNITVNGEISLPSFIRLTNAGANNAYISESWGINLNGASTHPIQVRSASLSVGYTLGAGTSYGSGNLFVSDKIGVNTTAPTKALDVVGSGIVASFGSAFSTGSFAGIHFGYSETQYGNDNYKKSALVFERTDNHIGQGSNASGKIHFLLNNAGGTSATSLSHSVVTIDSNANGTAGTARVGIGRTSPFYALDVNGQTNSTSFVSTSILILDADLNQTQQPEQGDPANKVASFRWSGNEQGYIDTDGRITFAGFKTPTGTASQFLKANGTVDSNVYITSAALSGYATQTWVNANFYNQGQIDDFFYGNEPILGYNKTNWDAAYNWGNHAEIGYLTTYENNYISDVRISETTLSFSGEGNAFTGDIDLSALPFAASSHTHVIADVTGLQTALDGKMPYYHNAISGDPGTAINGVTRIYPTANGPIGAGHFTVFTALQDSVNYGWQFTSVGNDAYFRSKDTTWGGWQAIATQTYVNTAIANLVDSAPSTLDTLNELAAALGDDPNFATTVTNSIATKVPQTRTLTINGTAFDLSANRSWTIDSADGYVSDVRLVESTLSFSGEGNAFTGNIDLSTLPFQPAGSYLTAEADTLATVTGRGASTSSPITINGGGSQPLSLTTSSGSPWHLALVRSDLGLTSRVFAHNSPYNGWYFEHNISIAGNTNWHSGNDGSGSGLDADLLDGNHASAFATRQDGARYSTDFNSILSSGFFNAEGQPANAPDDYGQLIVAKGIDTGLQIFGGYNSNNLWFRGWGYGPEADGFYPWRKIWHDGNDGSGSGLDADLLDGQQGSYYQPASTAITTSNIASQSVSYATSSGNSVSTDQTNFSELFIDNSAVATKEFVTSQGYLTSLPSHNHDDRYYTESESDSRFYLATNPSGYITSSGNTSGYSGSLSADDNRTISPSEIGANQLKFGFTSWSNNNSAPYADFLHLRSYGDHTGGSDNLIMFKKSGIGMRIWQQSFGSSTAYSSYADVWTTGDFSSTNVTNWNTAYGWGNHADAPYWNVTLTDDVSVAATSVRFNGNVRVDGDLEVLGTITETSSIRFKENITPLDPALDKVNQLEAVSYNKVGADDREIGLIAEEVAELFPEVVTYNDGGQPQGIQYQRLSVILLKAMQEQNAVITALTERVNKLENK